MNIIPYKESPLAEAISGLVYCNPFLPERIEWERKALGPDFDEQEPVWSLRNDPDQEDRPNVLKLIERAEALAKGVREELRKPQAKPKPDELRLYEDLVLFTLYHHFRHHLHQAVPHISSPSKTIRIDFYDDFLKEAHFYLDLPGGTLPVALEIPHLFACFFHIRRAFHQIFSHIVGGSIPAAKLRAAVWQSIFTHDMRRYRLDFYKRMGDFTTLVTGPSGTGKELVARAIGFSRYVPFDPQNRAFPGELHESFFPINLSALPDTLIESELFGHKRGAFTGALQDRKGWLELCGPLGTVFLDEIGDLDAAIQVKLLRVIQQRTFQSLGETREKRFEGKIIAATNRDLARAIRDGRFREDFYYRLCSDVIATPSLQERLQADPTELRELLLFIARRFTDGEAEPLVDEVESWIRKNLGLDYPWPGNVRELEQCLRNVLIRKEYHPPRPSEITFRERFRQELLDGKLTADELMRRYATMIYSVTGTYEEVARRLQIDRRTAKSKIDQELLKQFKKT
jgi:transcriptional regulator with AAA-type ATPase domain